MDSKFYMSLRPKFTPVACSPSPSPHAPLSSPGATWIPLIECPANFPAELLIHHPEYNSTLILRSETIADVDLEQTDPSSLSSLLPSADNLTKSRCIHRKLLPRRPGRDASLEQYCTLYKSEGSLSHNTVLILTPIASEEGTLPYYHPRVHHIAFRFIAAIDEDDLVSHEEKNLLRIEVVPFPDTDMDPSSRLFRTSLSLLDTLHRYGWGALTNYQKRVIHDVLIPREQYQDLYLVMRERHKGLVDSWQEVTDPLKHVFEDIGIATYLMLLWRVSYGDGSSSGEDQSDSDFERGEESWKNWPRPPGGFLDFGCGNGLLTHILVSEGYEGYGIDVRARLSWKSYSTETQERLLVYAFNPLHLDAQSISAHSPSPSPSLTSAERTPLFFPPAPGTFIISNHADELTPWTPIIASLYNASGFISIPCCAWDFDGRYGRDRTRMFKVPSPASKGVDSRMDNGVDLQEQEGEMDINTFIQSLNLGGLAPGSTSGHYPLGSMSGYAMYRVWLATLSVHTGWEVECETLRIPSTRNWALVGRKPSPLVAHDKAMDNIRQIIRNVKERGVFRPRKPEGKAGGAGDH
ncbi:hypothetical protein D9757_009072 [Collybiopsis confluens]|uniref:tRNA (uracil-O(2)-)-methyltransferase n=1 Tax=Collybiopsis confluens TaxID=2823264 RepID=A0A8H5HDY1_9AGAR|nr:hypothetical protein D9757_009072 [Collybiopsis confluens]